jgi:hypothetical protein
MVNAALAAVAFSGDNAAGLGLGALGLAMTIGCIVGIISLAKHMGSEEGAGSKLGIVLGIGCLAVFAVGGLFLTGCGAMLAH